MPTVHRYLRSGLLVLGVCVCVCACACTADAPAPGASPTRTAPRGPVPCSARAPRARRSWIWNQFFVIEEYGGREPVLIGRLRSSLDQGDGRVLYVLSGEGAGSVFVVDGATGNIHVTKPLDREEKDQYRLVATVTDRRTGHALEASSQFIIRVQDINDNAPKFGHAHYSASVPERAGAGTSVIQVTATDADDQSYGNSAKLVYSVIQGQQHFTAEPHTGVVRTATSDMDREVQSQYVLVLEARDMAGHLGGLTGTTSITVNLSDVNDNPPRFTQRLWVFSVSELALPGVEVGRVSATDADVGENAEMVFSITDGDGRKVFNISGLDQQGVIILNQALDYETHRSYTLAVEVRDPGVDTRFLRGGVFGDEAVVRVVVANADEPPRFARPLYRLNVSENCRAPCSVGRVSAVDPDTGLNTNIEYSIDPASDPGGAFRISAGGLISTTLELDREQERWHNLTAIASQRDSPDRVTRVAVAIETLDVNDNPPELDRQYEMAVCDSGTAGQVIQVIRAVDRDQSSSSSPVRFSLPPQSSASLNVTIQERGHHTANLLLLSSPKPLPHAAYGVVHAVELPIILQDGESSLSSVGTVTVTLCPCGRGGVWVEESETGGEGVMEWERRTVCSAPPSSSTLLGFTSAAMSAALAASFILAGVAWSLSVRKRRRSHALSPAEDEEIRENIISYDVEGGGEEDTAAFDIAALKSAPHRRCAGAAPPHGQLCYSIRLEPRPDRLTRAPPRGYWARPGSAPTRTREGCEGSAEGSHPGHRGVAGRNQFAVDGSPIHLVCHHGDGVRPAGPHLLPPVSSPFAPENMAPGHAAPFRTMEGTLLGAGAGIPSGTTFPRPNTARGRAPPPATLGADELLRRRLDRVTFDPAQPPYDSLRMYEHEGVGSGAGSLSSIESQDDGGTAADVLKGWEPKFQKLLEVLRGGGEERRAGGGGLLTEEVKVHEEEEK